MAQLHSTRPTDTGHDSIRTAVIEILAAQALCAPDAVQPQDRIESLGIDSLGMAEVIFAIEERFDVSVPFDGAEPASGDRAMDLTTVAGVIAAVESLLSQPAI